MTSIVHTMASRRTDLALARLEERGVLFLSDHEVTTLDILKVGASYTLDEIDLVDDYTNRRRKYLTLDQVREEVLSYFTTLVKIELL